MTPQGKINGNKLTYDLSGLTSHEISNLSISDTTGIKSINLTDNTTGKKYPVYNQNQKEIKKVKDAIKYIETKYKKELSEKEYQEKLRKCIEFEDMLAEKFGAVIQYH